MDMLKRDWALRYERGRHIVDRISWQVGVAPEVILVEHKTYTCESMNKAAHSGLETQRKGH